MLLKKYNYYEAFNPIALSVQCVSFRTQTKHSKYFSKERKLPEEEMGNSSKG